MAFDYVLYETDGAVARILVNRPDVLNAISRKTYWELDRAFAAAEEHREARSTCGRGTS